MPESFELPHYARESGSLLDRARSLFAASSDKKIQELLPRLPEEALSGDKNISLVFAGQYSAGKSSLLKVLTGRDDIATGSGITTQECHSFDWEGMRVVDTPGIHTEVRPDHDELSYKAIAAADLLVFVITNELFDAHLAAHFRKLAVDRDKGREMMLVVNKMDRCAGGNRREAQDIIREALRAPLAPFSPEELHISFIDAKSALESRTEEEEDMARLLARRSGMDTLLRELNAFVREKGLAARYTTSLYRLEQVLQEALARESSGDVDLDALKEITLQKRRALAETRMSIERAVDGETGRVAAQVRRKGYDMSEMIHGASRAGEVNKELRLAQQEVRQWSEELGREVESTVQGYMESLLGQVQEISSSALVKNLHIHLEQRIHSSTIPQGVLDAVRNFASLSSKLGEVLSADPKELGGLNLLGKSSGKAVQGLGKGSSRLGNLAKAGKALSIAGTVLSFAVQTYEDKREKQQEEELKKARLAVRQEFNEAARSIEQHFSGAVRAYTSEVLSAPLREIDSELERLTRLRQEKSDFFLKLHSLLSECRRLINRIHDSASVFSPQVPL